MFVVIVRMGMLGLYLAMRRAELPVSVRTMMNFAFTSKAVFTADDATDSEGVIGPWAIRDCWRMWLYDES